METVCMKSQILFSGKNKKNITNLLSAEFCIAVDKDIEKFLCISKKTYFLTIRMISFGPSFFFIINLLDFNTKHAG